MTHSSGVRTGGVLEELVDLGRCGLGGPRGVGVGVGDLGAEPLHEVHHRRRRRLGEDTDLRRHLGPPRLDAGAGAVLARPFVGRPQGHAAAALFGVRYTRIAVATAATRASWAGDSSARASEMATVAIGATRATMALAASVRRAMAVTLTPVG